MLSTICYCFAVCRSFNYLLISIWFSRQKAVRLLCVQRPCFITKPCSVPGTPFPMRLDNSADSPFSWRCCGESKRSFISFFNKKMSSFLEAVVVWVIMFSAKWNFLQSEAPKLSEEVARLVAIWTGTVGVRDKLYRYHYLPTSIEYWSSGVTIVYRVSNYCHMLTTLLFRWMCYFYLCSALRVCKKWVWIIRNAVLHIAVISALCWVRVGLRPYFSRH